MAAVAKKPTTGAKRAAPTHPAYKDMIKDAIAQLKDRNGSSRQALKKYIQTNYKITAPNFESLFNSALRKGVQTGDFTQPKGPSGTVKLGKKEPVKKELSASKKAAAKKAATKKAVTKKAAPKKAAPKKAAVKSAKKTTAAKTKPSTKKPAVKKADTKSSKVSKAAPKKAAVKKSKA